MRPCACCQAARELMPHAAYPNYDPACLWCGARLIQRWGAYRHLGREEIARRRRSTLTTWIKYGHSELELRRLAKGPAALAPDGPAPSGESARPRTRKRP